MLKHCSKEEHDKIYQNNCQHEWYLQKERDELGYPLNYYRCSLCKKEVSYLPRLEQRFDPR